MFSRKCKTEPQSTLHKHTNTTQLSSPSSVPQSQHSPILLGFFLLGLFFLSLFASATLSTAGWLRGFEDVVAYADISISAIPDFPFTSVDWEIIDLLKKDG